MNTRTFLISGVIAFLGEFLSPVQAQQIVGKLLDEKQEPVSFANVVLLSLPDSTFIQGTVTDEQGVFSIQINDNASKLLRVTYIGYDKLEKECTSGDVGTLSLISSAAMIEETVITASRAVHRLKNGNLVTDVANSLLSKEHSSMNLLKKIPGMTIVQGNLEVFGAGSPIVYINNRKVSNKEEIAMLDPKNIKEVELITNPGAKYDAEGKAVLKITTLNRDDGWSARLAMSAIQSRRFSDTESANLIFKKKGVTLSAFYSFGDYRGRSKQEFENELLYEADVWKYNNMLNTDNLSQQHDYQVSLDYSVNENHALGVQYTGLHSTADSDADGLQKVTMGQNGTMDIASVSKYDVTESMNHVNLFYLGRYGKNLSVEFNADYVNNDNDQKQNVNEVSKAEERRVNITTDTKNELYAAKLEVGYASESAGNFTLGGELSRVKVDGGLRNPDEVVADTKFNNRENKQAGYFMYDVTLGKFGVNAGVRYETVRSEMNDLFDQQNNIHRTYRDWFPNVSVSANLGQTKTSLSYSVRTTRPAFSRLNSNAYYDNQFSIQLGNPQLTSQQSHNVQTMFNYKFLNLRLTYSYIKDYIGSVLSSDEAVIINSWKNYKHMQMFRANLNLTHTFGLWNTTLSGGISIPSFKIDFMEEHYNNNTPQCYVQSNNYFSLPGGYVIMLDYMFNNGGSIGIYKYKPYHSLNVGIQKSFFKDQLDVSLNANDLFRTMIYKYDSRIGNIRFYQKEDQDERYFSVSLIYRFNKVKAKYRGTGAANEEIKRL